MFTGVWNVFLHSKHDKKKDNLFMYTLNLRNHCIIVLKLCNYDIILIRSNFKLSKGAISDLIWDTYI